MNTDNAKYTVVEFINAFGTKVYALRSPSGLDIDTDYANEQKLQRRADDLNKEIEVASANLRNRNMELEAALDVTTESLNKANYEKYLLVMALESIYNDTLGFEAESDEAEQAINLIDIVNQKAQKAIADEKQAPVTDDSDTQEKHIAPLPLEDNWILQLHPPKLPPLMFLYTYEDNEETDGDNQP